MTTHWYDFEIRHFRANHRRVVYIRHHTKVVYSPLAFEYEVCRSRKLYDKYSSTLYS